ncbi:MAG: hypothetical protein ACYS6W_02265 [Planctomycetota bacterium]|jgi:hypothetical protein
MRNAKMTIWMLVAVVCLAAPQVMAWIQFNDGGIHDIDYQINDDVWVDYNTPGMETTVNFLAGGSIASGYELQAHEDSIVNIFGGGMYNLWAYDNSQIVVSGGSIYNNLIGDGSNQITVLDGLIGGTIYVTNYCHATVSGGLIEEGLRVRNNGQMTLSGGLIYDTLEVEPEGILTIEGLDFAVDGVPVGYGNLMSILGGNIYDEPTRHLTGTLANGDPVDNDFYIGGDAKIVLAPAPPYYTLTMNVEPNDIGINTVTPGVGDHNCAGTMPLSATQFVSCPDVYQFDYWIGDVNDVNDPNTSILMDSDKTVTAVFVATRECGDECHPDNLFGDYNHDCVIDFRDFAAFADNWLVCTKPECD